MASDVAPVYSRHYWVGYCKPYVPQKYMKTHVTGQPVLGELRHAHSAAFFGNPLFSPQEQLLAIHRIHECEDAGQLTRWLQNTTASLARRHPACPSTTSLAGHVV